MPRRSVRGSGGIGLSRRREASRGRAVRRRPGSPWLTGCLGSSSTIGHPAVDRGGHVPGAGDLGRRSASAGSSRPRVIARPTLESAPVQHDPPALAREVEQVQGLQGELEVLQRRDVQGGDQRDHVGDVERREHLVVEGGRGVDDDVVEVPAQHVEDPRRPALAGIDSALPGSTGATSVVSPGECGVSRAWHGGDVEVVARAGRRRRWCAPGTAAARSPRRRRPGRGRPGRPARRPRSARAAARLVASVVLPQPPLAENTVTIRAGGAGVRR